MDSDTLTQGADITASEWMKGISLTVLATLIGALSKLAIRKSWLMEQHHQPLATTEDFDDRQDGTTSSSSTTSDNGDDFDGRPVSNHASIDFHEDPSNDGNALPSSRQNEDDRPSSVGSTNHHGYLPIMLRMCGMLGMTTLNPLFSLVAVTYASPSILAPFSGLTLVWIVLFSEALVDEKPTRQQIVAASLIVLGEVFIAMFGDHTNDAGKSIEYVLQSYREPSFLLFIFGMSAWMIFLLYYIYIAANTSSRFQQFAWGVAGGSLTGFQNFIKDAITIFKAWNGNRNSGSDNDFPFFLIIFMVSMAIGTAFTGFILLSLCMKRYDATYSVSMFVGSFCISASIMSAIHYDTFSHLKGIISYIGYPTGLFILLFGVYVLLRSTTATATDNDKVGPQSNPVSPTFVDTPQTVDNDKGTVRDPSCELI